MDGSKDRWLLEKIKSILYKKKERLYIYIYIYIYISQYIYISILQNTEFIYKKLCIYPYMFKLQSPSKYPPFDVIHLPRFFFPLLKTVYELVNFDAF